MLVVGVIVDIYIYPYLALMMLLICKRLFLTYRVLLAGGRDGSEVLEETEVLYYPGQYVLHQQEVSITGWAWTQQNMLYQPLWHEVQPTQMRRLPLPLTGHCVVDISPRQISRLRSHWSSSFITAL